MRRSHAGQSADRRGTPSREIMAAQVPTQPRTRSTWWSVEVVAVANDVAEVAAVVVVVVVDVVVGVDVTGVWAEVADNVTDNVSDVENDVNMAVLNELPVVARITLRGSGQWRPRANAEVGPRSGRSGRGKTCCGVGGIVRGAAIESVVVVKVVF